MPVDMSRFGLEGIETAQRTLNSEAARESQRIQDFIKMGEFENTEQDRAIDEQALNNAMEIAKGNGLTLEGPEASAEDFGQFFDTLGTQYLKAGAAKRGTEMITAGMEYRKKAADVDKADDDANKVRLDNMITAGDWVARNIGENESEFKLFLSQLDDPGNPVAAILGPENVQALNNAEWSPDLANFFRSKALSIKDQATLELTAQGHRRQEQANEDTEAYRSALLELNRANLEERRRENARKEKVEGTDVGKAATNAEIGSAKSIIINNVKALNGTAPEEGTPAETALNNMAEDIVGRAKIILSENKGVTFDEAVNQAVGESEAAGDFSILEDRTERFLLPDKVTQRPAYQKKGRTAENPIQLPTGEPAVVRKKLVKGRYYTTPMGVLKWNGSSFDQ